MKTGAILVETGTAALDASAPLSPAQRLVRTLQCVGVGPIVLLTPLASLEEQEKRMAHWGVLCLPDHAQGRADAVDFLVSRCDRLLLAPSDVPFVSTDTMGILLNCGLPLVRPRCREVDGWPLLLPAQRLAEAAESGLLSGTLPAETLNIDDAGSLRESLAAGKWPLLRALRREEAIRPTVKLRLCGERPFLGPGVAQLLSLIDATESVRMASQQMGLSYSKAWKMISVLEEELGEAVVLRCQGGKHGGSARISPFGLDLLEKYRRLEEECQAFARSRFRAIFGGERSV